MKNITVTCIGMLLSFASLAGDILTLNNEMVFDGKVKAIKNCYVVFKAKKKIHVVPASDIYSIEFEDRNDKVYTDYLKTTDKKQDHCMQGSLDADNYHGKRGGHFVLGVLFGPFAMIGTALANPTPDKGVRTYSMSKNRELFDDPEYLTCYRKKAKGKLIGMEALGWGAWVLFFVVFILPGSST